MSLFARIAALTVILSCMTASASDISLPVVEEHYDEVIIVTECLVKRDWQLRRAYFIRDNKIIDERAVFDEMLFTVEDGKFLMVWEDYGQCRRRITFDHMVEMQVTEVGPQDQNPWWAMGRNMRRLKEPPQND